MKIPVQLSGDFEQIFNFSLSLSFPICKLEIIINYLSHRPSVTFKGENVGRLGGSVG